MPDRIFSAAWIALCLATGAAVTQEKVFNTLSTDHVEQMLKGLNLDFKKTASTKVEGNFYYDFNLAKRFSTRLHFYKGKDLMLDALFPEQTLETLNRWNTTRARFTRATFHKDAKSAYAALEANFTVAGGVTDNSVRRFFRDFEEEVVGFDRFLNGRESPTPIIGPAGDKIFVLTTAKLEDILGKMELSVKKHAPKADMTYYDYESAKNYKIRLTNHGNQEVTLDAVFKKMPLDTINKYNFNRKFIRVVLYTQGDVEYTALAANLDCSVGISENMIRHFMITFEEEVQTFIEFVSKN